MTMIASAEAAGRNRRRGTAADGVSFWHTLYIGTSRYNMAPGTSDPEAGALFPMAFLVEQDPGSTASAHFHQQDQFQVVVRGHGTLGLHAIRPVTVHFTAAYTAYGPIQADPRDGVSYFTLRNGFDPGARFMKTAENRAALRAVSGRRHREAVAGPLPAPTEAAETLLSDADGLGAWRHAVAPGAALTGGDPALGRGQYWLVTRGTLRHGGETLPAMSCVFVHPGEAAFAAEAGPAGAEVIAMQFPRRAPN